MAQLSRPYQIALGAVAVLALVWVVALRGHSGSPSEPAPSSPSSPPAASPSPGAPSHIYHGPAPGVEGLTRDIAKAHGAVATSEKNAQQLGRDSAQASGEPAASASKHTSPGTSHTSTGTSHTSPGASSAGAASAAASKAAHRSDRAHKSASSRAHAHERLASNGRAQQQLEVEHQLAHGKTVLLLFWDPRSSVDNSVRSQVLSLGKGSKGKVAVHTALSDQVGLFGTVTEVAHVYQTPTILIVGRRGLITTLTGLLDAFSLKQAVREAEQANR